MTDTHMQVLSAFCDGEIVDPAELADALGNTGAHASLVDIARVRAALASSAPLPRSLIQLRVSAGPVRVTWRAAFITFAAAVVLLALLLIPTRWTRRSTGSNPPTPTRVVRYVPGVDWKAESH